MFVPNSFRSVPSAALAGSVAPITSRHFWIASGASSTITTAGPDDMKSVSPPKNGLLAVHRVEALGFLLRQVHQPHRANPESGLFDPVEDLAGELPARRRPA